MIALRSLRCLSSLSAPRILVSRQLHEGVFERRENNANSIHPTAVVHPDAVIGKDVIIGPFCTVGSSANVGNDCQLHPASHIAGDTQLGEGCVIQTGAIIGADLPGKTIIGSNNVIGHHAVVGVRCQDLKYKQDDESFLDVGDNNDIREYVSIHRSSKSSDKTVIGDNNLIMGSCHIAHDCKVGNHNIFANNTLFAGHVVVEDYIHTAGATVVHQFCQIGAYSFIGGGSVITQDVPRYMMVSGDRAELRGLNLEGLRRCGFSRLEVRSMRKAYQKIFMPTDPNSRGFVDRLSEVVNTSLLSLNLTLNIDEVEPNLQEECEELAESPLVRSMVKSIRESIEQNRRGICKFRQWSGA